MITICPIKSENGELDKDALRDLVAVGGHLVEAGIRDFTAWKQAMEIKLGNLFNEGDFVTIWRNVKADAAERTGERQTLTTQDVFGDALAHKLGSNRRAADFMNDVVGPNGDTTIINKMIEEKPLTDAEQSVVDAATEKHLKIRKPGQKGANPQLEALQQSIDAVRESRSKPVEATRPVDEKLQGHTSDTPSTSDLPDDVFDRNMAGQLGSKDAALKFRDSLPHDLYFKLVNEGLDALDPHETDTVTAAFTDAMTKKAPGVRSDFAKEFEGVAKEARFRLKNEAHEAELDNWDAKIGYVKDQLAEQGIKGKKMEAAEKALKAVKVGDDNALAGAFNTHSDRGFAGYKSVSRYVRNALLSNPGSLGTALTGHLVSAGLEHTLVKGVASRLLGMGRIHADIDMAALGKAIAKSLNEGTKQSYGIAPKEIPGAVSQAVKARSAKGLLTNPNAVQWHGDTAAILSGQNKLPHSMGLNPEFTVGRGGKVGNAVSSVVRQGGRMHGALWHAVSVGLDDIALQDAARYAAHDEMAAQMKKGAPKWSDEELRARAHELYENPTEKVRNDATDLREEQMFQNGNRAAKVLAPLQDIPGLSSIIPFVKVGANITGRQMEFNPFGAAGSVGLKFNDFAKANNMDFNPMSAKSWSETFDAMPAAQKAQIARITARGVIGATLPYAMGYAGYKMGSPPRNKMEAALHQLWHVSVNAPSPKRGEYGSVNVPPIPALRYPGGKYEYNRVLTPLASQFTLGAAMARANENHHTLPSTGDLADLYEDNPFSNFKALEGIAEPAVDYVTKRTGVHHEKASGAAKVAGSVERTFVPTLWSGIVAMSDPRHVMRDTDSANFGKYMVNVLKVTTGVGRSKMPPKMIQTGPMKGRPIPEAGTIAPVPRHVPYIKPGMTVALRNDDEAFASGKIKTRR